MALPAAAARAKGAGQQGRPGGSSTTCGLASLLRPAFLPGPGRARARDEREEEAGIDHHDGPRTTKRAASMGCIWRHWPSSLGALARVARRDPGPGDPLERPWARPGLVLPEQPEDVETKRFGWLATGRRMESGQTGMGETEKRRSTGWHGPRLHFMCPRATELGRSRRPWWHGCGCVDEGREREPSSCLRTICQCRCLSGCLSLCVFGPVKYWLRGGEGAPRGLILIPLQARNRCLALNCLPALGESPVLVLGPGHTSLRSTTARYCGGGVSR